MKAARRKKIAWILWLLSLLLITGGLLVQYTVYRYPSDVGSTELYNLKDDIGERNNLAKKIPEKTKELSTMLADWRRKVHAQMMELNPNFNPQKAKKSKKQE